ncbi:MAG: 23S rRNA (guanosine(2251)-2'-O)-methyltransferase RlmB [Propionibacteriaceae bacterium]|jgi:23S rRNA (guanosine2251-2'-O)-methyltransferase|nr:23S rRNA (guanosine(2251)-2'-O)-methyltransferase RlmB [Propionibacteriaceae bacterium]
MSKGRTTAGSGGRIRKSLAGRGPTPKAEDRTYHQAYKNKQAQERRANASAKPGKVVGDWVVGRNPGLEALAAGLPVKAAYIVEGADRDDRLREILKFAAANSISMLQATRSELDRLTGGAVHQGVALMLPSFDYADFDELLDEALDSGGLVVAADGLTDPHNLGAIIRSTAAFAGVGVVIPSRRSAKMTAAAWKASAGAAARLPVSQVVNLNRALDAFKKAGFTIIGLAGEGDETIDQLTIDAPIVLVVGSEGAGLSRLVREHCDHLARIPISGGVESLNASVATGIALYQLQHCPQANSAN